MKILSRKQQMECIKRLNAIRIITDDMNYKAYGEEVKKMGRKYGIPCR